MITDPPLVTAVLAQPPITQDPWQFRLTAEPHPDATPLGDYWFSKGPDLPVVHVCDDHGRPAGVILGFAIELDNQAFLAGRWTLPAGAKPETDAGVQQTLRALAGRFLWICLAGDRARIYPDSAAQVSCVWQTESRSAGTTAHAILSDADYAARFHHTAFEQLDKASRGWFVAGLTAHSGVLRLLPNHYLDLTNWSAHRIPQPLKERRHQDPNGIVEEMIATVQSQIAAAVASDKTPVIALTAGYESRAILACARPWLDRITFMTLSGEDRQRTDGLVARRIAEAHGLRHAIVPSKTADVDQQRRYLRRAGHAAIDSNVRLHPSCHDLPENSLLIGGLGGDLWRAPLAADTDGSHTVITPQLLMNRLGLKMTNTSQRFLQRWLDTAPALPPSELLALAYRELQLAPWAMAQFCADPTTPRLAPFLTHRSMNLIQSVPQQWRDSNDLSREIIQRLWVALDRFPYNTLGPQRSLFGNRSPVQTMPNATFAALKKRRA